jgi:acetyl-CoA acyltransferase
MNEAFICDAIGTPPRQAKAAHAQQAGIFAEAITPVVIPQSRRAAGAGEPVTVLHDEHPRATTVESLARRLRF